MRDVRSSVRLLFALVALGLGACGPDASNETEHDSGLGGDATVMTVGMDASLDASADAGIDASGDAQVDAGGDAGVDAHVFDCTDGDSDGYGVGVDCLGPDCDDGVGSIHAMLGYYTDADGDGVGGGSAATACVASVPAGSSASGGDCDDGDPWRSPNLPEIPDNSVDDDCDGAMLDAATPPSNATYVANVPGCITSGVGTKATPVCSIANAIYQYEAASAAEPATYPRPYVVFVGGPIQQVQGELDLASDLHVAAIHGGYDATTWTRANPIVPTPLTCVPNGANWVPYGCFTSDKPLTLTGLDIRGPASPSVTPQGEIAGLVLNGQGTSQLRDLIVRGGTYYGAGHSSFALRTAQNVLARDVSILGGDSWCGSAGDVIAGAAMVCVDCAITLPSSPICGGYAKGLAVSGSLALVNSTVRGTTNATPNERAVGVFVDSNSSFVAIDSVVALTHAKNLAAIMATWSGSSTRLLDSIVTAESPTSCSSNCDSVAIRASVPVAIDHAIVFSGYASGVAYENPSATFAVGGGVYRAADMGTLADCPTAATSPGTLHCPTLTNAYGDDASLAFVDAANANYRLASGSYGVGLGAAPNATYLGWIYAFVDVDGVSRPQTTWDIGINEQ